jgi:hypothetical protein
MRAPYRTVASAVAVLFLGAACSREALAQTAHQMSLPTNQVAAQTSYIPYFGKNKIRYNNFNWHIYTTDHFEVYFYPEIEQHLERVVSYAESAYQAVSSDLKHDLRRRASSSSRTSSRPNCRKACSPSPSRTGIAWSCRSTNQTTRCTG